MIGIAGSIISPNKTAANQRADAFNFPQAGSRAEANPGNGHAAHSYTQRENVVRKMRNFKQNEPE